MSKFELTMIAVESLIEDAQFSDGEYDRLTKLLGELTEHYEDLETERDELKEQLAGLEDRTVEDFTDGSLPGIEPIHYKTENLLDGELMATFGKLLGQLRPHDLLNKLDKMNAQSELYNSLR